MFSRSLNKDLYGPARISAKTAIKDVLLRDHVLQEREWHSENARTRNPWKTSFSISFEKPGVDESIKHGRKLDVRVDKCHQFSAGLRGGPSLATTAADFDNKLQGAPIKAAPCQSTSIADFAPKYMSDKSFGKSGSVYDSMFAKEGQGHGSSAKNRAECQQHTDDLNATHFQFGNDFNGYGTETRQSFKNKLENSPEGHGSTNVASKTALETYKSSVFRHGDWNVPEPRSVRHSVTCNDFHIKPFSNETGGFKAEEKEDFTEESPVSPKDDPNHPYYQRSTHFVLGTHTDDRSSLYYKDFMLGKRECLLKPLPAPPPISSKVLPNLEDCLPSCSTNTADFVNHKTHIREIGQRRDAETKVNRERHTTQAVVLTCDERRHTEERQASLTGADYLRPSKDHPYLSPQKEPRSRYRYLDSDGALLRTPVWPAPSETKEEFIPIEELVKGDSTAKLKEKKADCDERIQDNRSTHFQFGSDGEPKHTEQHDQFLSSLHLDPALRAAGKSEGPEQKYSHVYPSESAKQGRQSVSNIPPRDKVSMIQNHIQQLSQQRFFNPRDPMNINLRKAFLEFDTSLSGKISKDDLRSVLKNLGVNMDQETFEKTL
ncbi:hypothetical protein OS493_012591 [Desmophyllum pertusum]|uniref:EF-hand domain-containing protein n=1 Tax=Desmophyllum pertusum TaxID=174260 RepID=A0A9X0CXR8_9CNID|nr:hypothetical protein OS493_012591 [Desmophyllum pertusum]